MTDETPSPTLLASFEEAVVDDEERLFVDVDGFEGPLDLLLKLARDQKVDLTKISILALAEQYLAFIETVRRLRMEIAADYLVMAAWLAYLKSRLLLPEEEADGEPSGEELAAVLAARLRHLEAIREAGRRLMASGRLGHQVFPRGAWDTVMVTTWTRWDASLYDLLSAYATLRLRGIVARVKIGERTVLSLQDARERLMRLIGQTDSWATLDSYLIDYLVRPDLRKTARASALSASLELVREGEVELKQKAPFAPLYIRRKEKRSVAEPRVANG